MSSKIAVLRDSLGRPRLSSALRYGLYVCVHPLDGFWDLTHEKRGSIAAANIIVLATIVMEVLSVTLSSFYTYGIEMQYFNVVVWALRIIVPLLMWTVANWSLTTLMDGKGHMGDVYMATSYALLPYFIIGIVRIPLSRLLATDEVSLYMVLYNFSVLWTAILIMAAMMMIHDYSPGKMVFSCFLSVVGMGVMVFVFLIFFSLISDCFAYVVSVVKEIMYRMN